MNLGRLVLVWTARHLLALSLIIFILIAVHVAGPPITGWVKQQLRVAQTAPIQRAAFAKALEEYGRYAADRRLKAEKAGESLRAAPEATLRQRRADLGPAIARQQAAILGEPQLALAAMRGDSGGIFAHYRATAELELLRRELLAIDRLLAARSAERRRTNLAERRREAVRQLNSSRERWNAARARAELLNRRPLAPARNFVCRNAPLGVGCENHRALARARGEMTNALAEHRRARRDIEAIDLAVRNLSIAGAAAADVSALLERPAAQLRTELAGLDEAAGQNWLIWTRQRVLEVLPAALAILAAAILAPGLIKAFLYFVIAPLAALRPPLRLISAAGGSITASAASPSQTIALEPGEELLVVPEAVQSTPEAAEKRTQWLLNWTMPLSSLASGMVALVRLRVHHPAPVVTSATGSVVAEVALVSIAEGSAMVLRPRALRGLLQPTGQPARISRHWRICHLSAWLTMQFRYLVFHGPCTLLVEGARGVRLEPAGSGRSINQAATLGFTASLAYSVSRSEAFGAYLLGRQELFNDRFAGAGYYLYEEVPREATRGSLWGRGLRGLGDAALKMFGL